MSAVFMWLTNWHEHVKMYESLWNKEWNKAYSIFQYAETRRKQISNSGHPKIWLFFGPWLGNRCPSSSYGAKMLEYLGAAAVINEH